MANDMVAEARTHPAYWRADMMVSAVASLEEAMGGRASQGTLSLTACSGPGVSWAASSRTTWSGRAAS